MTKNTPHICLMGFTGVGKSTMANTFSTGWTANRARSDGYDTTHFETSSSQDKVCTLEIKSHQSPNLFGNDMYGPCTITDTPGLLDPEREQVIVNNFLQWVHNPNIKYITYIIIMTAEEGRFSNSAMKTLLAIILHVFGPTIFQHVYIIVNKWPMNPLSEEYLLKKGKYIKKPPETSSSPESIFTHDVNNVCSTFKKDICTPDVEFINNYYLSHETHFWERYEYRFAKVISGKSPFVIDKETKDRCIYYQGCPKLLYSYDPLAFENNKYALILPKIEAAQQAIDIVYKYWGDKWRSARVFLINNSPFLLKKVSLTCSWGAYENIAGHKDGLSDLDGLGLDPFDAKWIFHRESRVWGAGVEGNLKYQTTIDKKDYLLELYWNVSYFGAHTPTVKASGTMKDKLHVDYNTKNDDTFTPVIEFTISLV